MALLGPTGQKPEEELPHSEESCANSNESDSDTNTDAPQGNAGWADSMARVLGTTKPRTKQTLVLSRAKKIKLNKKPMEQSDYGFEVEGEVQEQKPAKEKLDELKQNKNLKLELRVKPSWKDMERERALRKIATKGVVQLFNAVRMQQKELQQQLKEAGPLDSRKDAVLNNINKRKFLDVLMGGKRSKSEAVDNTVKDELKAEEEGESSGEDDSGNKEKAGWSVLREDFMTNKKIKHWDEEENSDEQTQSDDANDDT